MADKFDDALAGQRGRGRGKRACFALLQSTGDAATGYSERLVGDQEIQLHGLSRTPARTAGSHLQQLRQSHDVCGRGADIAAVLSKPEGTSAAATDERGGARRSGLVDEVSERSFIDAVRREAANAEFVSINVVGGEPFSIAVRLTVRCKTRN